MTTERRWRVRVSVAIEPIDFDGLSEGQMRATMYAARDSFEVPVGAPIEMSRVQFSALQCAQQIMAEASVRREAHRSFLVWTDLRGTP